MLSERDIDGKKAEERFKLIVKENLKNYILYYGVTEQLRSFFKTFKEKYPDTKLNPNSQIQGSINSWRPSMIVKSILD